MKTNRYLWITLSVALLLALPFIAQSQDANVPAAINYQGRLTDTLGNPVSSGYYEIQFRVWKDAVQTGAANLIWGRSFPLHVVTNGLFNILLTDAGGMITSPDTPLTNSLLYAFSGPDRYLGLTITISNNVSMGANPAEISPRQQLASAPFALQAGTANTVALNGVGTLSLANGSVTSVKIAAGNVVSSNLADNAVITAKIADGAVTTAKLTNGAVTSAKLSIDDDVYLNNHALLLSTGTSSGLKRYTNYNGFASRDAAVLYGAEGGFLTTTKSNTAVLSWSVDAVGIEGRLDAYGSLVDLSKYVNGVTNPTFTVEADGTMMFYGRRGYADFQVFVQGSSSGLFAESGAVKGIPFFYNGNDNDGRLVTWPLKRGDKFRWNIRNVDASSSYAPTNNYLFFMPLGKNQTNTSVNPH